MIDATQVKEVIELMDDLYEVNSTSKDIIKGARTKIKEAKTALSDYADKLEMDKSILTRLYDDYAAYKDGKADWDEDGEDDYTELLILVQDEVKKEKG